MKVAYPLSLKVSVWLLLNLLLLAVFGAGFFIVQGGLGWSALLIGATEDRVINRANEIARELAAASPNDQDEVLARASATYGAQFLL